MVVVQTPVVRGTRWPPVAAMGSTGATMLPPPSAWGGGLVWDADSARRIPGVERCLKLLCGVTKQMPMDAYRGVQELPRPRILDRPDPHEGGPWFVEVNLEDYLLQGNAISVVVQRMADGWPAALKWIPAQWVYIAWAPGMGPPEYYLQGAAGSYLLPYEDVVHVKRGADRNYPVRGVGVVEQHFASLDRVALEEEYERSALAGGAVPSVAVVTPNPRLSQDEAEDAKERWLEKFAGPQREPVFLPNGTQVIPLAWSPSDAQLSEARKLSLGDVANMFNVDGYWLGAPASGFTYRTAGPMYQSLLRVSIEPLLADLEDVWSDALLPRGQRIRFDRNKLLRDDLLTTAQALTMLVGAGIVDTAEARLYLALPGSSSEVTGASPVATVAGQNGGSGT
jgi:HK97 family phage portal protein